MRRIAPILAALLTSVLFLPVRAADVVAESDTLTASRAFAELPGIALELLPRSTRLDMLDYYAADSLYQAPNAMEGLSQLTCVTPDFLEVRLTSVSTLQLKVLPSGKYGNLLMTVYTIGDEKGGADSEVRFYDTAMNELDASRFLELPRLRQFFDIPKGSLTSMKEVERMVPFHTTVFSAAPSTDDLTARLTIGDYMDVDDFNIIRLFMKPELRYRWDGSRFRLTR